MKIKKYSVIIYTVILFLLSVSVVVYIFPKDKKFEYDFSEGNPWLHENLIADFDFPIYKTDKEIEKEKDSILSNFIPYYTYDTAILAAVFNDFSKEIQKLKKLEQLNTNSDILKIIDRASNYAKALSSFEKSTDSLLTKAYEKGVIKLPDSISNASSLRFYLSKNRIKELSFANEFFSPEQVQKIVLDIYNRTGIRSLDSINGYSFRNMIAASNFPPNLLYDPVINKEICDQLISEISPTMGMVQKGELIISKGNIVSGKEFKVLSSLKKEAEADEADVNYLLISIGIILLFLSLYSIIYIYLLMYHKNTLLSFKNNTFFTLQSLLIILAVFFVFRYTDSSLNVIPFTLIPVLLVTFYNFHVSFFIYLLSILVSGFFAPNGFEFIFIQLITGIVAMISLRKKQRRQQIFVTMLLIFVCYTILYIGFNLMRQGSFSDVLRKEMISYAMSSVFILLYVPIVYIYEKLFGFISDFTLLEISDTNSPALRALAEKAPGTFQHSMQTANIVESVVQELGGNYLLARAGALYHDIGKLEHPEYFIENQTGANIHDNFDFEESAQKIISHVKTGIELAHKYKLPKQIINFISMHHGSSVTRYFYNSWLNANPNSMPNLANFTYPGPKPQTLETAVMMMADAIEAASRTLKEYNPKSIEKLVNSIVSYQLEEGQFDDVDITLKQITTAKGIFIFKIKNIYHSRIEYPEVEKKQ
jgi:putative nucleotidyltransferase with HDIG domain